MTQEDRYYIYIAGKRNGEWTSITEHYEDTASGAREYMSIENIAYVSADHLQYDELQFILYDDANVHNEPLQVINVHFE